MRKSVEISVTTVIPSIIKILMLDGSRVVVAVDVPWLPPKCSQCSTFGHSEKNCIKKLAKATQVGKPVIKQSKPLIPIDVVTKNGTNSVKGGSTNRFSILTKEMIADGNVIGEAKTETINTEELLEGDFSINIVDKISVTIAETVNTVDMNSVDTVDAIGKNIIDVVDIVAKNITDIVNNADKNSVGIVDAVEKIIVDTVDVTNTNTVDNVNTVDKITTAANASYNKVVDKGDETLKVVNEIKDVDTMAILYIQDKLGSVVHPIDSDDNISNTKEKVLENLLRKGKFPRAARARLVAVIDAVKSQKK
ncbi:hypothetical protein PTKIN_Ptkin03bG0170400 [Pterospermum kingtungense]